MTEILNYFNTYSKKPKNRDNLVLVLSKHPKNDWVSLTMIEEETALYAIKINSKGESKEYYLDTLPEKDKKDILNKLKFKYD